MELARKLSKKASSGHSVHKQEQLEMAGENKRIHQKVADLENYVLKNDEYALYDNSLEVMMMERA